MSRIAPLHVAIKERRSRRAFTLVELLVVITIIAVLIAILLPALGLARQRVWDAGCASNCKQSVVAWLSYTVDHGHFPHADIPPTDDGQAQEHLQPMLWAGVDWYTDEMRSDGFGLPGVERPLNDYLGMPPRATSGGEALRCPGDNFVQFHPNFSGNPNEVPEVAPRRLSDSDTRDFCEPSLSPDSDRTFHGAFGNSYFANDFAWVSPSAPWGLNVRDEEQRDLWLSYSNGPEDYEDPSRFVLISERGIADVMRGGTYSPFSDFSSIPFVPHNFRHGEHRAAMGFLDGSARIHDMPVGFHVGNDTADYDFAAWPRRIARLLEYENFSFRGRGFVTNNNLPPSVRQRYGF